MNSLRDRGALWGITAVLCLSSAPARAATVPVEGNPVLRSLLASFLGTEELSDAEKVSRFDEFLTTLQWTSGTYTVRSLQEYIMLRNRPYGSVNEARAAYRAQGLVTPLNVSIAPASAAPEVMEGILSYEAREMASFLEFVKQNLPDSPEMAALQSPLLEVLPQLFLQGQSFKHSLDQNSAALMQKAFAEAEQAKLRGSPTGIFSFMVGVGLSGLRSLGENVVNPFVQQLAFTNTLKAQLQRHLAEQISNLRRWPPAKKLAVMNTFNQSVQDMIQKALLEATHSKDINALAARVPLVEAVRNELIPAYFTHLRASQKSNLVWQVFSTPGFSKKPVPEQVEILLSSLGPLLPHLLRHLSFGQRADLAPAPSTPGPKDAALLEKISVEFAASYGRDGLALISLNAKPLAITEFNETFAGTITTPAGLLKSVVIQRPLPGITATLEQDLAVLRELQYDETLMSHLRMAGAVEVPALIESLSTLAREEVNLSLTRAKQARARQVYAKAYRLNVSGRQIAFEIVPAVALPPPLYPNNAASATSEAPTLWVQDFVGGLKLSEVPAASMPIVQAALKEFTRVTLLETLSGSGFVWGEATAKNMRVEISPDGNKVVLRLLNFGSATFVEPKKMKELFITLGKLPLSELAKTVPNFSIESGDPQKLLSLIQQSVDVGLKVTPQTLRLAQQFINLREVVGPEVFKGQLLSIAAKNPGLLWAPLGAAWKRRLESLYAPLRRWFGKETLSKARTGSVENAEGAAIKSQILRCEDYL
jgi:hypothetical protein